MQNREPRLAPATFAGPSHEVVSLQPAARAVNFQAPQSEADLETHWRLLLQEYDSDAEDAATLLTAGGTVKSILSAKQAQKMVLFLLEKATTGAVITAYTFNAPLIKARLVETAARGVKVKLFVDRGHSLTGTTGQQMSNLQELSNAGIEVYLVSGPEGGGIQHSKTLLVDHMFLVGSTNWTSNSRSNHEMHTLLELKPEGVRAVHDKYEVIRRCSKLLTEKEVSIANELRTDRVQRAKSEERYSTAKRFSLARERTNALKLGLS